ncbi:hypothetical protein RchiOBHm_Chr1g0331501 [Rosa chinensis]|uniref:Uncharacterized protein n=1 Tax=Rosa chinensis TaxID=74649 RepID=A0A2P6SBJ0_ROSCH|nr:hypothetical protein RchiOBHm_Chr1g0331501 [Rosa chinensis]
MEVVLVVLPSSTMEVGSLRGVWGAEAGWWVHEILLGCQAGLDGCKVVKEEVLFF